MVSKNDCLQVKSVSVFIRVSLCVDVINVFDVIQYWFICGGVFFFPINAVPKAILLKKLN